MCFFLLYSIIGRFRQGGSISSPKNYSTTSSNLFLAFPRGGVIFRKGELRHLTVKKDVMNAFTAVRKHRFIPMMSSSGMGTDVTP